jgi:branched-chain amino acid transport system substrate-binding protein
MQATSPDLVYAAALPVDTAGLIRAANEVQLKPKMFTGSFLGLLITGIKQQLGPLINGIVANEFYIPAASLQFAGTKEFLDEYQKPCAGTRNRSPRFHLSALCLCRRASPRRGRERNEVAR